MPKQQTSNRHPLPRHDNWIQFSQHKNVWFKLIEFLDAQALAKLARTVSSMNAWLDNNRYVSKVSQ
jgi:hypothetical protein